MGVGKPGFLKRNTKMHKVDLELVVHPVGPFSALVKCDTRLCVNESPDTLVAIRIYRKTAVHTKSYPDLTEPSSFSGGIKITT